LVKFLDVSNSIFAETIKNNTNISYRKKKDLQKELPFKKTAIRSMFKELVVIFRKKQFLADNIKSGNPIFLNFFVSK
jgi:hypothetical protein